MRRRCRCGFHLLDFRGELFLRLRIWTDERTDESVSAPSLAGELISLQLSVGAATPLSPFSVQPTNRIHTSL